MAKTPSKKELIKELIAENQRGIWLKEISKGYFQLAPNNEVAQKNVIAADVEIAEMQSKMKYFEALLYKE